MFVDGYYDNRKDRVLVSERVNGERILKEYKPDYNFYYADPSGSYSAIDGTPLRKVKCNSRKDFLKEKEALRGKAFYESDLNVVYKVLSKEYKNALLPELHIGYFDIETDYDGGTDQREGRGFAPTTDPFNAITAITLYLTSEHKLVTVALAPKNLSGEEASKLEKKYENLYIFDNEEDMLKTFLDLIEDTDCISGFNSSAYDIPYTINRVMRVLGKDYVKKFCLWNTMPKEREFERYGSTEKTYDLIGRVHLDYLELYRKYTYSELPSYSLDNVAKFELKESKTPYTGTLDELYNKDFDKFIEYNRQDTLLLFKLEEKLKFIGLVNQMAHDVGVTFKTTMGAVAVSEQAIINQAHEMNLVVPDRKVDFDEESDYIYFTEEELAEDSEFETLVNKKAAGAHVTEPKPGLHDMVGIIDIKSLYPNTIITLNMSPETIVAQIKPHYTDTFISGRIRSGMKFAKAWENVFATLEYDKVIARNNVDELELNWEPRWANKYRVPESMKTTGAEIYDLVWSKDSQFALSANGTIFDKKKLGIIPALLIRWFDERMKYAAKADEYRDLFLDKTDNGNKEQLKSMWDFFERKKHSFKIFLNSVYGALLNEYCRFYDYRLGQSTTLCGRTINKHMSSHTNNTICGIYTHDGESTLTGDTDSVMFSAQSVWSEIPSKEDIIELYDSIAQDLDDSFPDFVQRVFNVDPEKCRIKGGCELIASKALFIKKKRYAMLYFIKDGKRYDTDGKTGGIKAMGLDLKRSDTPKFIQDFLSDILRNILEGTPKEEIISKIKEFKKVYRSMNSWEKGRPCRVNNFSIYREKEKKYGKKARLPGHVRASLNWNALKAMNHDPHVKSITDGSKVTVIDLKPNLLGFDSVAIPNDETRIPQWFKDLPFDNNGMEAKLIDKKLKNLVGVLGYDLSETSYSTDVMDEFFD